METRDSLSLSLSRYEFFSSRNEPQIDTRCGGRLDAEARRRVDQLERRLDLDGKEHNARPYGVPAGGPRLDALTIKKTAFFFSTKARFRISRGSHLFVCVFFLSPSKQLDAQRAKAANSATTQLLQNNFSALARRVDDARAKGAFFCTNSLEF